MKLLAKCVLATLVLAVVSCSDKDESLDLVPESFDFSEGSGAWTADFTDYAISNSPYDESLYNWTHYYGDSAKASNGQKVHLLACDNINSDVFMFLKTKVSGLRANTNYNVVFDVTVASNAQAGGGVTLKVGGSDIEPKKVIENNYCSLNIDKGTSFNSGENLIAIGDIGSNAIYKGTYEFLEKSNANAYGPLIVKTNSKGELWLIVGTDSLLPGYNAVYYSKINVVFSATE